MLGNHCWMMTLCVRNYRQLFLTTEDPPFISWYITRAELSKSNEETNLFQTVFQIHMINPNSISPQLLSKGPYGC